MEIPLLDGNSPWAPGTSSPRIIQESKTFQNHQKIIQMAYQHPIQKIMLSSSFKFPKGIINPLISSNYLWSLLVNLVACQWERDIYCINPYLLLSSLSRILRPVLPDWMFSSWRELYSLHVRISPHEKILSLGSLMIKTVFHMIGFPGHTYGHWLNLIYIYIPYIYILYWSCLFQFTRANR